MSGPFVAHGEDPSKDYRRRYQVPDQFVWDEAAWARIDFDGYTAMALDLLPHPPGRVLDVGCGPGLTSRRLLERGYEVTGVDYNERAVGFAKVLVPGASFLKGDIRMLTRTEGLDSSFDAAICIEVLEHVPPADRAAVLGEIGAVVAPGGRLVITTPSARLAGNPWDYERPDLPELRSALRAGGFEPISVRYQHRLTTLFHPAIWRLFSNDAYDIRAIRRLLRRVFLARWNEVRDEARAGRYVIAARRS
jgi:2-polyprenyl-3-methyl-5-hydroxy-6-metoxy-1,4-benzoquinol methylase